MEIRKVRPDEAAAVHAVVQAAFGHHEGVAELVDELRGSGRMALELVAVEADAVVGHVALDECWVDDDEALVRALCLSPLSVRPDRQRAGLGGRLVADALDAARARGTAYVFLEGDPGYYGTRGFGPALDRGFLRPTERIPGPAFQVAVLEDRGARGRVVYPDAFWRHDAAGLRGERLAQVREALGE